MSEQTFFEVFGIEPNDDRLYNCALTHRSYIHQTKKNIINLAETTIEFWQEENKILSKKNQIQSFLNQVDQIAGDVERFEARLNFYIESKKS